MGDLGKAERDRPDQLGIGRAPAIERYFSRSRRDLTVGAISMMLPQVRSRMLKALTVTSAQRSALAPDIPTAAEAGLPQLQIGAWICFMGTGGTPAPLVARLDEKIAKALAVPEACDALAKQGVEIFHMDPQQLGNFLHAEAARFGSLLQHSRVKGAPQ